MSRSWLPRNIFLISGVVISHLLILLGFLSASIDGEWPYKQGVLMVGLIDDGVKPVVLKKSIPPSQINSSSNTEFSSLIRSQRFSSSSGAEGEHQYAIGATRRVLHNPEPHYPLVSRRLKEQGLVVVKLCVNDQGVVGESSVSKSSGFQNLDQSALKALSQWRFVPLASNLSNFTSQCFQTPVKFTLEG